MSDKLAKKVAGRFVRASGLRVGEAVESGTVRMHRFRGSLKIWDLTNAGKRGKKVDVLSIASPDYNEDRLDALTKMLSGYTNFKRIQATLQDYMKDYPEDYIIYTTQNRGVDVKPAGFKPIEIKTPYVYIEADYNEFRVKDLVDKNNEPTCISKGGKRDVTLFYRWVQDNKSKLSGMKYHEIVSAMSKHGIKHHSYCAMD